MANRGQTAQVATIPAPTGGINGRDSIANMPPTDAVFMSNFFPQQSSVDTRNGSTLTNTIPAAFPVKTLVAYNGNSSSYLFAGINNTIYDVTTPGVNTLVYTGINSIFQWCQMGTIGGRFLLCFDGVNNAAYFDGTTWSATSFGGGANQISGVDPKNIINCNIYKNRLYLVEKNSANVWYLPINSIYGAATKLDLSSIFKQGSFIVSMATWTIDNSGGLQEYAVFISDVGEIVTYQGSDPSVATDFKIAARFNIGRPIGKRCFEQMGSDIIALCEDGAFPLSQALLTDRSQLQLAVTDKIKNLISKDIADWFSFGASNPEYWCVVFFPTGNKLIINTAFGSSYQYVMNTDTGSWTIFSGWDANCFVKFGSKLYFGSQNGKVYEADTGNDDDGVGITVDCQQAFQYFGSPNRKQFTAISPTLVIENVAAPPHIRLDFDFNFSGFTAPSVSSGTVTKTSIKWDSVLGFGSTAAPRLKFVMPSETPIKWLSTDVMYKTGGLL